MNLQQSVGSRWTDYELLDTGNGRKLERVGEYRIVRPASQALWKPGLPESEWGRAVAEYRGPEDDKKGSWIKKGDVPESWTLAYGPVKFSTRLTSFRHLGFFPEQSLLWDWMVDMVRTRTTPKVLNLFGYTGIATLLLAEAGAHVTHVDASKQSVAWARENQTLSGLEDKPIRWIVDDALAYVRREARRGSLYDGIVMDPPKFGRGPKGEVWKAEEALAELFTACREVLTPDPLFIAVTAYTIPISAQSLAYAVTDLLVPSGGTIECGELANSETGRKRRLTSAIFARWSR